MDGFCFLYLLLFLLMKSGDVETNPGPNPNQIQSSTVSEKEFWKLAKAIPRSSYEALGIHLKISYADLDKILSEKANNYTDALLCVLMRWNVNQSPQTNKRQLLADTLQDIELVDLSYTILKKSPIPNSTGGPSRLSESQTKPPSPESEIMKTSSYESQASDEIQVQPSQSSVNYSEYPTPVSSHRPADALCSMQKEGELTLGGRLHNEFYSTLKECVSFMQVHTLKLHSIQGLTPASSRHLAEALCSMLKLNYLRLRAMNPNEEFYSKLRTKASSLQVQTLELILVWCPTRASLHNLAEALCSMPNLSALILFGGNLTDKFWSILKAKASTIQGSFPQIRKGNFKFNEVVQEDLNSFLHTLACPQRLFDSDCSSDSDDNSADSGNSNVTQFHNIPDQSTFTSPVQPLSGGYHGNTCNMRNVLKQSRAMNQETMASTSRVNPVHANISVTPETLPSGLGSNIQFLQQSQDNVMVGQPLQQPCTLMTQSGIWPVYFEKNALPWNPGPSQPQFMPYDLQSGLYTGYHTPAPNQPFSGYYYSPEYREACYYPAYHATLSSSAPSPNPPVSGLGQPTMFAGYPPPTKYQPLVPESTCDTHTIMPWSSQDHYRASTSSSTPLCNPPVSHQSAMSRQHISDEVFQPMVKEQARSSIPQPSQDHSTAGLHSASKDQPILQERTRSSSQISHLTNFSSSIRSRPYKRKTPHTQSRVPHDDPEIPTKQSKV